MRSSFIALFAAASLAGCASWSTSSVEPNADATPSEAAPKSPAEILVTEGDITDRAYESLGDISVTVNKTTVFSPDPTPALVNEELREEAAALGADAVILVRYGTVGVSLFSWGSLDGTGRAVRYVE